MAATVTTEPRCENLQRRAHPQRNMDDERRCRIFGHNIPHSLGDADETVLMGKPQITTSFISFPFSTANRHCLATQVNVRTTTARLPLTEWPRTLEERVIVGGARAKYDAAHRARRVCHLGTNSAKSAADATRDTTPRLYNRMSCVADLPGHAAQTRGVFPIILRTL